MHLFPESHLVFGEVSPSNQHPSTPSPLPEEHTSTHFNHTSLYLISRRSFLSQSAIDSRHSPRAPYLRDFLPGITKVGEGRQLSRLWIPLSFPRSSGKLNSDGLSTLGMNPVLQSAYAACWVPGGGAEKLDILALAANFAERLGVGLCICVQMRSFYAGWNVLEQFLSLVFSDLGRLAAITRILSYAVLRIWLHSRGFE